MPIPKFAPTDNRADVLIKLARANHWKHIVEVGVLDGRTSALILQSVKWLRLTGVDLWKEVAGTETYPKQDRNEARARQIYALHRGRADLIKKDSAEAAASFKDGSVDCVFIDADHSEEAVRRDIEAWMPKVRRGGILCGHDASEIGVRPAIDDLVPGWEMLPNDCWAIRVLDQKLELVPPIEAEPGGRVALVLGGASCVWDDVGRAVEILDRQPDGVVACNDIGAEWPDLDAWVSIHGQKFPQWQKARKKSGLDPVETWTHDPGIKADKHTHWELPGQMTAGTSGLFAAKVALVDLGFDKVILCGIPMDAQPHFFDDEPWKDANSHWPAFEELAPEIKARMRSMSGRTCELLGAPTEGWA